MVSKVHKSISYSVMGADSASIKKVLSYTVMGNANQAVVKKAGAYAVMGSGSASLKKVVAYAVVESGYNIGVVNGDAGTGTNSGWTVTSGGLLVWTSGGCVGPNYFYNDDAIGVALAEQTLTIDVGQHADIDLGNKILIFKYCNSGVGNGGVVFYIDWLDGADALIQTRTTARTIDSNFVVRELHVPTPALARKIKIRMELGVGTNFGYTDGISGTLVSKAQHVTTTIENPGAETNSTAGWREETGGSDAQTYVPAHTGTYHFSVGDSQAGDARMVQLVAFNAGELATVAAGGSTLDLSVWRRSFESIDSHRVSFIIYDALNNIIESSDTGWNLVGGVWTEKVLTSAILPTDATTIEIMLEGRNNGGGFTEAYYDDVTYSIAAAQNIKTTKTTSYTALQPSLGSLKTFALTSYSVLKYAPIKSTKSTTYSVLSVAIPVKVGKINTYIALRPNRVSVKKVTSYSALRPNRAFTHKLVTYSAMAPRPPSARANVLKSYTVLSPLPPVITTKTTAYTILKPPPPKMRNRKSGAYTVLSVVPPISVTKMLSYTVLKSPPPIVVRTMGAYTVMTPPPIALVNKKVTSYTVMASPPTAVTKVTTYTVLIPLSGVPLKSKKNTSYTVLKFNAVVNPNQNIVVIIN